MGDNPANRSCPARPASWLLQRSTDTDIGRPRQVQDGDDLLFYTIAESIRFDKEVCTYLGNKTTESINWSAIRTKCLSWQALSGIRPCSYQYV